MPTNQTRRTLGQLRDAVRRRVPITETDTQLGYEIIDEFINTALRQVSVEHNWPWLLDTQTITTTASDDTYNVDADFLTTKTISENSSDLVLRNMALQDILEIPETTTDRPQFYVIDREQVVIRPVPDGVYTLTHYFYRMEPALSGDSSQPFIPYAYDEGVVEYATYLCLRMKREDQRAVLSLKAYQDWVRRTADNLVESREPKAPRVRRGGGLGR